MDELVERLAVLLKANGTAHLRTGTRRSDAEARKMLRDAAASLKKEVLIAKGENFVTAKLKGKPKKPKA